MRVLFAILAALLVAGPAWSAYFDGLTAQGNSGFSWVVYETVADTDYLRAPARAFNRLGFTQGSTFEATVYACHTKEYAAGTCESVATLDADVNYVDIKTGRPWLIIDVTTAETAGSVSYITIQSNFQNAGAGGGSGGVVGSGPLADMLAYGGPQPGDLWQQTDDDGTGDCGTGSGSSAILCQWNAATEAWEPAGISSGIANVVEDATPQLGGNLDPDGKSIGSRIYYVSTETEFEAALTACGDGVGVTGQSGCTIQLEGGVIDISDGVSISGTTAGTNGRAGVVVRGAGGSGSVNSSGFDNAGTVLNWTGTGGGSVLSVGACFGCEFHGFSINGNDDATAGIEFLSATGAPTKVDVHNIGIWDVNGTGILGNTTSGQFDESSFRNIHIRDSTKCVHVRHAQSVNLMFGPYVTCTNMNGTGPFFDFESGSGTLFKSYCGITANSSTCVSIAGPGGDWTIDDNQMEAGGFSDPVFIDADSGVTGSVKRLTLTRNRFVINSSSTNAIALDFYGRGVIEWSQNKYTANSGTIEPSVTIEQAASNVLQALIGPNTANSSAAVGTAWIPTIAGGARVSPVTVAAATLPNTAATDCIDGSLGVDTDDGSFKTCEADAWIDPPNLAAVAGDVYSGAHDFGGATLEVPNGTDCSGVTAEGRACWDSDDDVFYVGNGSAAEAVGSGGGGGTVDGLSGDTGGTTTGATVAIAGGTNGVDTVRSSDTITINLDLTEISGTASGLTAGNASVAAAVTIADNESTDEDNAILFTPGGDVDGGNLTPESDGDFTYNPSTGTLKAPIIEATGGSDGTYGTTLNQNTSAIGEPAAGKCKIGFVGTTLNKHCEGGSLTSLEGGSGDVVEIAAGTAALGTSAISSGACATVVTSSATGVATTDVVSWSPNADISGVTGYAPVTTGALIIYPYPTANNVNFKVCNPTSSSITPGAVTLNWRVNR